MNFTMTEIKKLREMTGAGLADCKKALTESEDMDAAVAYLRKKGAAVAAKRSDREAAEGCVLVKSENGFAAIIALKCETDFVANNADFVALTQDILNAAVAAKCKTLDEVKALPMGEGTVQDAVTARSGITGEKMELDGYSCIESDNVAVYNHMNRNGLCAMVAFNKPVSGECGKNVAMQIASSSPVAIDESGVSEEVKQNEYNVAVEKTKEEQVKKAVEVALKKAGINPAHVDSEDHMESNMAKGWITAEDVEKAKKIIAETSAEKAANLPAAMVENIAKGRVNKFLKENCLLSQEYIWDKAMTVAQYLQSVDKELKVTAMSRFTLKAE
ncbi:MAG: elongation factor Ts [Bacteroidaceae bacterium]|jgi:elongation factor Ts|nr:elongation factor Ts [Bacteroidaceae bacterium]MBR7051574.1 elongation factor Ts [Bacteroidaceae bacterium]